MAEENNAPQPQTREGGGGRSGRPGGQREGGGQRDGGGFRIRLSDNELRAVRAIQDAFNLRSTVAALGFSVRTVAQLLEEGKLDALVAEMRANGGGRPEGRGDARRGEGRGDRRPDRGGVGGGARVNPFARPQKPVTAPAAAEPQADETEAPIAEPDSAESPAADAVSESVDSSEASAEA